MRLKSGFVLLIVVVILSVVTGLILAQNKMIQLALRRQHLYASYQSREVALEVVAEQLMLSVIPAKAGIHSQGAHCARLKMDLRFCGDNMTADDTMLQKQIILQGQDYASHFRYLITDLGDYPCMKLSGSYASHHWLLSLFDIQAPTRLLQLRIATPIPEVPCINHPVAYHPSGVLSWRSLVINPTKLELN